ncbi:MAG TPA: tetratricopeptide repeat protein [Candidatus Polarisedimenticolia bacterium]|nr:tetratricopeptide repeat protein [Candidatus Polarisedimenticolia bacterium]
MSADLIARYSEMFAEGTRQIRLGEYGAALKTFQAALAVARETGEQPLIFRATCSLSGVLLSLGEVQDAEKGLREILLKSQDDTLLFLASSNLASALRRQGKLEKALFFGRRALRAVARIDNATWKATCHNLIANIYLNMSYLDDAIAEYRVAMAISQKGGLGAGYPTDLIKENLGYCLLLKKRYRPGIALILEALQIALTNGASRCVAECYQDLSFAYMQLKELKQAEECGEKALTIGVEKDYPDLLKNCYYLLGEINLLIGNEERSDHYFSKLQELYPHLTSLKDFLRTFDVSDILNLKNPF